jgi:hypothetical protein
VYAPIDRLFIILLILFVVGVDVVFAFGVVLA